MTLITPWAVLLCSSKAACGQGEYWSRRKSWSCVHFRLRSWDLHIHTIMKTTLCILITSGVWLNISHHLHEMFTCFLQEEWAFPQLFLFFMETVVKLRGIQSRGNPAEEKKKAFWLESILAGGECCSRDRVLNYTFSEKLCAYIILKWSPKTVKCKL